MVSVSPFAFFMAAFTLFESCEKLFQEFEVLFDFYQSDEVSEEEIEAEYTKAEQTRSFATSAPQMLSAYAGFSKRDGPRTPELAPQRMQSSLAANCTQQPH